MEQAQQDSRFKNTHVHAKHPYLEDKKMQAPSSVIMKLIHSKAKTPKVPNVIEKAPKVNVKASKVNLKSRRIKTVSVDDSQDRIKTFFENMFPVHLGEKRDEIRNYFCIDDESQTGNGSVRCKICLDEFVSALKLQLHLATHKNLMYKCQYCPLEVSPPIFI